MLQEQKVHPNSKKPSAVKATNFAELIYENQLNICSYGGSVFEFLCYRLTAVIVYRDTNEEAADNHRQ